MKDIVSYSDVFNEIVSANLQEISSPNIKHEIDLSLDLLGLTEPKDFYPILMLLIKTLKQSNIVELQLIISLICDYMIRIRIVHPYRGGGDIRNLIFRLLSELCKDADDGTVEPILDNCNHDFIHQFLSYKGSKENNMPRDLDFKNMLQSEQIDTRYAKACLMRIEYRQTKNTPARAKDITIEHLMPQTLTDWWREYLGAGDKDVANEIHENYLGCIGNLALVSGSYNSSMSNHSWDKKKNELLDIQFRTTNKIPEKYPIFKEKALCDRTEEVADLAIKHIESPALKSISDGQKENDASAAYKVTTLKNLDAENDGGIYFSEITDPDAQEEITGIPAYIKTKPVKLDLNGTIIEITNWYQAIHEICKYLYQYDRNKFECIVFENKIHKKNLDGEGQYKPIITAQPDKLEYPYKIPNTEYYVERTISAERSKYYSAQILREYNLDNKCKLYIRSL